MITITPISQWNSDHANEKLGTSSLTIGRAGCLITCVTVFLNYIGYKISVKELNEWLKSNGGYVSSNLFVWNSIEKLRGDIDFREAIKTPNAITDAQWAFFRQLTDEGKPVFLQVDHTPSDGYDYNDMHFVLLLGFNGNDPIIFDPAKGDICSLTRYGTPKYTIQRYVIYFFERPMVTVKNVTITTKGKHNASVDHMDLVEVESATLLSHWADGSEFRVKVTEGTIEGANLTTDLDKKITELNAEIEKWKKQFENSEKTLADKNVLIEQISNAVLQLESLLEQSTDESSA